MNDLMQLICPELTLAIAACVLMLLGVSGSTLARKAAPVIAIGALLTVFVMQLSIAQVVGGTAGLPDRVALALRSLLSGNVDKVLISVAVWLPYLLLSTRVNLTFRHRLPA